MSPDLDVRHRLDAMDETLLARLGVRRHEFGDDVEQILGAWRTVREDAGAVAVVQVLADQLWARIGTFPTPEPIEFTDEVRQHPYAPGTLSLLAFVATAPEVVDFQVSRGIGAEQAWHALSDLGQQLWVNWATSHAFGLQCERWLSGIWLGNTAWLGRLQFHLVRRELGGSWADRGEQWWLDTHIPQSGPLTPESVQQAFARAQPELADHFGVSAEGIICNSWLLAPELSQLLPGTNLAAFQQSWELTGRANDSGSSVYFFGFGMPRGYTPADLSELPERSSLHRALAGHLRAGGSIDSCEGVARGWGADLSGDRSLG